MSVNVGVFIDVSNLFYSARSMGVEVNYIRLLEHVTRNRHLIRASAYTGIDPENGSQRRFVVTNRPGCQSVRVRTHS